jgi:Bacteriophage HK97-gp10, putative tail-component
MRITATVSIGTLNDTLAKALAAAQAGLASGVEQGAEMLAEEARMLVPVDTGNLQRHIHTNRVEETPTRQTMQVVPFDESGNEYGFDPPYARRIEYGFIGTDKLGRHYHQAAQPYMRPARDIVGPQAVEAIKQSVLAAVKES